MTKGLCNTGRTHFKKGNTPWNKGLKGVQEYTEERNKKISLANKGNHSCGRTGKKDYLHICKICGNPFITKTISRSICDNKTCQSLKGSIRKYDIKTELKRRKKISKKLKGKMPKNLENNIYLKQSPPQKKMYKIIKKYFPSAVYNYYVKTQTRRFLDVGVPELKLDFEYNGKCHLLKSVQENDIKRTEELKKLGWKIIVFDKSNINTLETMCKKIKENGDVYNG